MYLFIYVFIYKLVSKICSLTPENCSRDDVSMEKAKLVICSSLLDSQGRFRAKRKPKFECIALYTKICTNHNLPKLSARYNRPL